MGSQSILDEQVSKGFKVLLVVDGYPWNVKWEVLPKCFSYGYLNLIIKDHPLRIFKSNFFLVTPQGMQNFPDQGLNLQFLKWKDRVLAIRLPEKSPKQFLIN